MIDKINATIGMFAFLGAMTFCLSMLVGGNVRNDSMADKASMYTCGASCVLLVVCGAAFFLINLIKIWI